MPPLKIILIAAGSAALLYFSWRTSIKKKRYHGIPRFFSFESIFLLITFNLPWWFANPFSSIHLLSWLFLFSSIPVAVTGFYHLHRYGKPTEEIENTTRLVTSGIFRYIRHPLYLSLFLLGTGAMLKYTDIFRLTLAIINLLALLITAKIEEEEMIRKFGVAYEAYMRKTKMFIPFLL